MTVSRRIFLRSSVATAIACASAPLAALGASRQLPRDTELPHPNASSGKMFPTGPGEHGEQSPEQRYANLGKLSRDSFLSAVGSAFKLTGTAGASPGFWLRLLSVTDIDTPLAGNPASMAVAPPASLLHALQTITFNLHFSGGPADNLQQGTFFVEHDELGEFALFIVPAGPQQYTAIFNRLPGLKAIPV
jgi:hypothetical protein